MTGIERRRVPRLNLATEQFRHSANGKIFPVSDLSLTGMAIRVLDFQDMVLFPIGNQFGGILNLKREKHEISLKIRRVGKDLVGCEFVSLEERTTLALQRFLDPRALGAELRPLPSQERGVVWYQGPSGTHLFLSRRDGAYTRLTLCVLGSYIQWENENDISTGRLASTAGPSEMHGAIRFETMLLEPDSQLDPGKLNIAKTLILSSNLPEDLKGWCVQKLEA